MYRAETEDAGKKPCCYTTFRRAWEKGFAAILNFTGFQEHGGCSCCSKLRAAVQTAPTVAAKQIKRKALDAHLMKQWQDRHTYWRMRALARDPGSEWIVLIIDGADQAKFRIVKATRWPHDFDGEHRPKCQVMGCWVHGEEVSFSLREEDVEKGSEYVIEILVRALSRVVAERCRQNKPPAKYLWIQADNCSGENKNQWTSRLSGLFVDRGLFECVVLAFLQVGHTHEDLDAVFGVMAAHIGKQLSWNTPEQMLEHVQRRMSEHLRPTRVVSGVVSEVRAWKEWLAPFGRIKEKDGITNLTGPGSSHWFCYCRRAKIPLQFAGSCRPSPGDAPDDVVMLVKQYMSDAKLAQPPVTFCSTGDSWRLPRAPRTWRCRLFFTPEFRWNLDRLARKLLEHFPDKAPAIHYFNAWLAAPRNPPGVPAELGLLALEPLAARLPVGGAVGSVGIALDAPRDANPRVVVVSRRARAARGADWREHGRLVEALPLETYVQYRRSVGGTVEEAEAEWRAARRIEEAAR